jgi:hypothetical protein
VHTRPEDVDLTLRWSTYSARSWPASTSTIGYMMVDEVLARAGSLEGLGASIATAQFTNSSQKVVLRVRYTV